MLGKSGFKCLNVRQPAVVWLVSEQMLWGPWSLQCLADTFLLVTRFIGSRVYFFQGHLESAGSPVFTQLCVLGRVTFPLQAFCSSLQTQGVGSEPPLHSALYALKFLDSNRAKSRPQWQSTHGKPLRWMSGAIVIVKIEQASELWPEHNESHFCRTVMMMGDQSCTRVVDVASPFGPAPPYDRQAREHGT